MASLDQIEGDGAETVFAVLAALVVGIIVLEILAIKKLHPYQAGYSVWSRFASWIDGLFYASPIRGGSIQKSTDSFLGGVAAWLSSHLHPQSAPQDASAYADGFSPDVIAGMGGGN